jgi:hypothetical protein
MHEVNEADAVWRRLHTAGARQGGEAVAQEALQEGFEAGFGQGAHLGARVGRLFGFAAVRAHRYMASCAQTSWGQEVQYGRRMPAAANFEQLWVCMTASERQKWGLSVRLRLMNNSLPAARPGPSSSLRRRSWTSTLGSRTSSYCQRKTRHVNRPPPPFQCNLKWRRRCS